MQILLHDLIAPSVCFAVATVMQPFVIRALHRRGKLDIPNDRSSHTIPTPRGGGIAVGMGLLAGVCFVEQRSWLPVIVALILFFAIGLTEDLRGVPTLIRLALQLATSVVVSLLLLLGVPHLPAAPVLVVVAALWITGFANAFNFMDGINGISGAHAVLCGIAFMVIGKITRHPSLIVIAAIIVAAGLAFLPWNAMRPRVFLGDVGSYTLGAVLAVLAIYCVLHGVPLEAVLAPMSLYLADTGWTLLRRILRKDAWMQAHREHAYQRLCSHGWAHHQVTMLTFGIGLVVTALGGVSITGNSLARVLADSLILVLLAVYLATPYYIVGMRASRVVTNLPADPETETMTTAGSTPQAEAELEAELQAELQANPVAASPS